MTSKKCTCCEETKSIKEYHKYSSSKDGYKDECKLCRNRKTIEYYRTVKGLITRIYCHQKDSSKKRGHVLPLYSKDELYNWITDQNVFMFLYGQWVLSGYDKWFTPSCDRLDDYKPYSFDNIQLVSWADNHDKHHSDRVNGINNKGSKKVIRLTKDGEYLSEYHSMHEAERELGIDNANISACCLGKSRSAGGYKWKFGGITNDK